MNNTAENNTTEQNLFKTLWIKYYHYWLYFFIMLTISMMLGFLYLRYKTPLYEATAKIIIKDEKKGSDDSKIIESFNIINTKKIIENEIEVLQSRKIINNTVKKLHLYANVYYNGKIRKMNAYETTPICIVAKDPDSIISSSWIKCNINYSDKSIHIDENPLPVQFNKWVYTKYGIIKFLENEHARNKNPVIYLKLTSIKKKTENILQHLTVSTPNKLSSVINMSYKDETPKEAEDVLNTIIEMYDKAAVEDKNSLAKNTLQFLEERLKIVSANLDSIENNVETFKTTNGASDLSTKGQLYLQNVSNNDQELGKINMQLAIIDQVYAAINDENIRSTPMMPSTIGVTDPNLTKMMMDLNNKELEYARLKKTIAEDNPLMISIKDQIEKIKPSILENLSSQKNNLLAGKRNLIHTNNEYNSILAYIPEKEKKLLEMNRDQIIKKEIYSFLLQKREESELSYASTLSDNRIINNALSSIIPTNPNKIIVYVVSIVLALCICFFSIYFKELFNEKINTLTDFNMLLTFPVIGEILFKKKKSDLLINSLERCQLGEEFRRIRLSLTNMGIVGDNKNIMITSSIPGEGKSFVAINLAISYSMSGKKVVLIDADMHKSGLNDIINKGIEKEGLADYLTNHIYEGNIIHQVERCKNLFCICAGHNQQQNPEPFQNNKFETLINFLNEKYDMIIIDTPPTLIISDSCIISKYCDTTLYIVRDHFTPKSVLSKVNKTLKATPLKNVGIIFNGIKKNACNPYEYTKAYDVIKGSVSKKELFALPLH